MFNQPGCSIFQWPGFFARQPRLLIRAVVIPLDPNSGRGGAASPSPASIASRKPFPSQYCQAGRSENVFKDSNTDIRYFERRIVRFHRGERLGGSLTRFTRPEGVHEARGAVGAISSLNPIEVQQEAASRYGCLNSRLPH